MTVKYQFCSQQQCWCHELPHFGVIPLSDMILSKLVGRYGSSKNYPFEWAVHTAPVPPSTEVEGHTKGMRACDLTGLTPKVMRGGKFRLRDQPVDTRDETVQLIMGANRVYRRAGWIKRFEEINSDGLGCRMEPEGVAAILQLLKDSK